MKRVTDHDNVIKGPQSLLLAALGLLVIFIGYYSGSKTVALLQVAERTSGIVAENVLSRSSGRNKGTSYTPRVEFKTEDGRRHSFLSRFGSGVFTYEVNESVPILYDPAYPENAEIDSFMILWFTPLILGSIGSLILYFGIRNALLRRDS